MCFVDFAGVADVGGASLKDGVESVGGRFFVLVEVVIVVDRG